MVEPREDILLNFNNIIIERDLDMLFAEAAFTDSAFCRLFVDKTDLKNKEFSVESVELSKTDSDLGESDVTIILNIEGNRYGFLIEDKIDACAMQRQYDRYVERGELGKQNEEYIDYRIFIFCPQKYYESNEEAKKYDHLLTYEECKDFFDSKGDSLSLYRSTLIEQALKKAKRVSQRPVDKTANDFLRKYIEYKDEYYPNLDLSTKEDKNGRWTDYRTELGYVYILHKIEEGYVDLIFPKTADKVVQIKTITEWIRKHVNPDAKIKKAKQSTMIRVSVPKLLIEESFENVDKNKLRQCFDVIQEFADFANIIELADSITLRSYKK